MKKEDLVPGGKGDNANPKRFDKAELHVGIAVEMEHTNDKKKALEIAVDHLTEDPKYYTKLVQSGIADESEALALAKKYGMIGKEKENEQKLREIIRKEIRDMINARTQRRFI